MITYLLLNEESLRNIEQGRSTLALTHVFDGYRAISKEMPELAIGLDDKWVRDLYKRVGLNITRLDYGSWCGRKPTISYQDMVLAVKA